MWTLISYGKGDGIYCEVKLYYDFNTAFQAFKDAVLDDLAISVAPWNDDDGVRRLRARQKIMECNKAEDHSCEEYDKYNIRYDEDNLNYWYEDYNEDWSLNISLQDLPIH